MERRKFVIGLGSLAAGGAAATGTGAFTTADVDRSAKVEVANDDTNAMLGFSDQVGYGGTNNGRSPYSTVSGGTLEVDFTASDAQGVSSAGLNKADSTFTFQDTFKIVNQGTTDVLIGIDVSALEALEVGDPNSNDKIFDSVEVTIDGPSVANGTDITDTLDFGTDPVSIDNSKSGAVLEPGQEAYVDWKFETGRRGGPFNEEISIGGVDVDA